MPPLATPLNGRLCGFGLGFRGNCDSKPDPLSFQDLMEGPSFRIIQELFEDTYVSSNGHAGARLFEQCVGYEVSLIPAVVGVLEVLKREDTMTDQSTFQVAPRGQWSDVFRDAHCSAIR